MDAVFIKFGALPSWAYLHVVEDLEEGEGHASADDHLVDLVQHVVDQLDLVLHLSPEGGTGRERERGESV